MSGEFILIIDDEPATLTLLTHLLTKRGYEVLTASNGAEGLEKAHSHKPDLILLDYMMPQLSGIDVLDELNRVKLNIPVIFVTAQNNIQIAVEAFRRHIKDYLVKPIVPETLWEVIERSLVELRLRREKDEMVEYVIRTNATLNQRLREIQMLHAVGKSLTAMMDIDSLLKQVVSAAVLLTSSDEGSFYLLDDEILICRALKRRQDKQPILVNLKQHDPLVKEAIETGKTIFWPSDTNNAENNILSVVSPLMINDQAVGALLVRNLDQEGHFFSQGNVPILEALANYAANALETAAHYAEGFTTERDDIQKAFTSNRIFVCYSREDWQDYVEPLINSLKEAGIDVWVDQHLLQGGQDWMDEIGKALDECVCMVLCVSPEAIASKYAKIEYRYFIQQNKPIVPLICRETKLPPEISVLQHLQYGESERVIGYMRSILA